MLTKSKSKLSLFSATVLLTLCTGFDIHSAMSNPTARTTCSEKSIITSIPAVDSQAISLLAAKRCEFVMETKSKDPKVKAVTCSYKCKGYGALANFSHPSSPCPPSFDTNFPGP